MPVIKNPPIAEKTDSPALAPNSAGKIRFPAPKKSEKIINPIKNISLKLNFFSNIFLL